MASKTFLIRDYFLCNTDKLIFVSENIKKEIHRGGNRRVAAAAAAWNPSIVQTGRDGPAHSWNALRASEFVELYVLTYIVSSLHIDPLSIKW